MSELPDDGDFSVRGKQIKVGLRPVADEAQMLLRPIFQSPTDPNAPHPNLKQPAGLSRKNVPESYLVQNDSALRKVFSEALPGIDAMLKNPALRREKEEKYFTIVDQISPEHRRADTQFAKTLGIRGVVAKEDIPAGTALIYSAQYLSASEWKKLHKDLSNLLVESGMPKQYANKAAANRLVSYSWAGVLDVASNNEKDGYELSAYGAGNVTAFVNHDEDNPLMFPEYLDTLDEDGNTTASLVAYIAAKDIPKNTEVTTDYGDLYNFQTQMYSLLPRTPFEIARMKSVETKGEPTLTTPPQSPNVALPYPHTLENEEIGLRDTISSADEDLGEIPDRSTRKHRLERADDNPFALAAKKLRIDRSAAGVAHVTRVPQSGTVDGHSSAIPQEGQTLEGGVESSTHSTSTNAFDPYVPKRKRLTLEESNKLDEFVRRFPDKSLIEIAAKANLPEAEGGLGFEREINLSHVSNSRARNRGKQARDN